LAHPLLLVVHGRAGGELPPELRQLAAELEWRRGAPVALRALTEPDPPPPRAERPLGLVPLLLLPGGHVRVDVPGIVAALRLARLAAGPGGGGGGAGGAASGPSGHSLCCRLPRRLLRRRA